MALTGGDFKEGSGGRLEIESQCSLCMHAVFAASFRVMKRATWEMFITSDLGCRERKMKRPSLPGDSDLLYQYPDTLVYKAPFEKVAANEQHTFFSVQENNNCSPQKSAKKPFPVSQTTSVLHQPGNEKRRLLCFYSLIFHLRWHVNRNPRGCGDETHEAPRTWI